MSFSKQTKPTNLYTVSLGPGVKDRLRMIRVKHQTQRETGLACRGRGFIYRPLCSMKNKSFGYIQQKKHHLKHLQLVYIVKGIHTIRFV